MVTPLEALSPNATARLAAINAEIDSRVHLAWPKREAVTNAVYLLVHAAATAATGRLSIEEKLALSRRTHFVGQNGGFVETPQVFAYESGIRSPISSVEANDWRSIASPAEKSRFMQGNVRLALESVLWVVGDRVDSWPSLVDAKELKKYTLMELAELEETMCVHGQLPSPYDVVTSRNRDIPWFDDPDARDVWEVASEVADVAFCALQYYLAYDGYRLDDLEEIARSVTASFDKIESRISVEDIKRVVHSFVVEEIFMSDHNWPELQLGLAYLAAKKIGVDLWEMVTLKSFTNARQYPNALRLVEKDESADNQESRRLAAPRSSAWVFMKNMRRDFDTEKRFIPPMADPIIGETVLDVIYGSPYLADGALVDLFAIAMQLDTY